MADLGQFDLGQFCVSTFFVDDLGQFDCQFDLSQLAQIVVCVSAVCVSVCV